MADRPPRWLLAVVLAAGVVVPGLVQHWLHGAGYGLAGDVVWVVGYVGAALAVWYGWLRPIEFAGSAG